MDLPTQGRRKWAGEPIATSPQTDDSCKLGQHCAWRNMVPETGVELTPDTFILEAGFERLNGVDFKKGCYVGQEVTARMKHKTELRKGIGAGRSGRVSARLARN